MAIALAVGLLGSAALSVAHAGAVQLPPGFQLTNLDIPTREDTGSSVTGMDKPTTIDFAPDGKMFIGDLNGRVKVFDSVDDTSPTPSVTIIDDVHISGDRGLMGMKLDPDYPTRPYIYLSYAYDIPLGGGDEALDFCNYGGEPNFDACVVSGRIVQVELDPPSGVAVDGHLNPPQNVLVNSWCQQFSSHSMGDIDFDSSGALLVGGGEGASFETTDHGQFNNPCGDPADEGGSLRAQDVRTSSDPTDYSGTIIRIDPDTGNPLPDNPLFESSDVAARRILAFGLRNPFRFEVRPGTDEVYIGDVGSSEWDELNRVMSPPAPGQGALNFGWPCYEGENGASDPHFLWEDLELPLCESLYDADPEPVTASVFAYHRPNQNHEGYLFDGDECDPSAGSAFSGVAFYDPDGVAEDDAFPEEYHGSLFMADGVRGCIWVMDLDSNGDPDPSDIENFVTSEFPFEASPVDIVQGPGGGLYTPNY